MDAFLGSYRELTFDERVFINIALFFLCGALLFILFLSISRLIKKKKDSEERVFRGSFQALINDIIFIDDASALAVSTPLISLRKLISESSVAKQVFIN